MCTAKVNFLLVSLSRSCIPDGPLPCSLPLLPPPEELREHSHIFLASAKPRRIRKMKPFPQCRRSRFEPWSGNWSHMPQPRVYILQIKILHAATKTWCSQINNFFLKKLCLSVLAKYINIGEKGEGSGWSHLGFYHSALFYISISFVFIEVSMFPWDKRSQGWYVHVFCSVSSLNDWNKSLSVKSFWVWTKGGT